MHAETCGLNEHIHKLTTLSGREEITLTHPIYDTFSAEPT